MKVYAEKMRYLLRHQHFECPILAANGREATITSKPDLDHSRVPNTKHNRRKYPLLIDSLLNLRAVDHHAHLHLPRSQVRMSGYNAAKLEAFLRRHPKTAEWVNNPK